MLFAGPFLIALWRDHTPGIVFPGCLDFPGGGREGAESPEACALRETEEEIGLRLSEADLELVHIRENQGKVSFFFVAHVDETVLDDIVFGCEGEGWQSMLPENFVSHPKAIPHFADILRAYLSAK